MGRVLRSLPQLLARMAGESPNRFLVDEEGKRVWAQGWRWFLPSPDHISKPSECINSVKKEL